jgi:lycopene cyclase CruA
MEIANMREICYLEVPTPDTAAVRVWLQQEFEHLSLGEKIITSDGIKLQFRGGGNTNNTDTSETAKIPQSELSIFVWSVQRTTT